MHRTEAALIARGLDRALAQKLRAKGATLGKLQQLTNRQLLRLGLTAQQIEQIRSSRPPIPTSTLIDVCAKSRWTCCVCKDPSQSIVVHHIEPWVQTHDHSEKNLAVLCLHHHGEAHTKRDLSVNLTKQTIRRLKRSWEKQVLVSDAEALTYQPIFEDIQWLYFNHLRLFAMADELGIELFALDGYEECRDLGLISASGSLKVSSKIDSWMYRGAHGMTLYRYCKSVMQAVWHHSKIINISDHFDRDEVSARLATGLIYVQGAFTFAKKKQGAASSQIMEGLRSANGVRVTFYIDRGEATSASAWSEWLSGRKNVGCVLRVHDITHRNSKITIRATAIAICMPINKLATRRYDLRLLSSGVLRRGADEDE